MLFSFPFPEFDFFPVKSTRRVKTWRLHSRTSHHYNRPTSRAPKSIMEEQSKNPLEPPPSSDIPNIIIFILSFLILMIVLFFCRISFENTEFCIKKKYHFVIHVAGWQSLCNFKFRKRRNLKKFFCWSRFFKELRQFCLPFIKSIFHFLSLWSKLG